MVAAIVQTNSKLEHNKMTKVKVTDEMLSEAVKSSKSIMGVLRFLGLKEAGGSHSHYSMRIKRLNINTEHFEPLHNKGKPSLSRKEKEQILVLRCSGGRSKSAQLKRAMIESGVEEKCSKCGQLPVWLDNPLTLDVDHINENWLDDRIDNLRFLCPNCHSQYSRNLINN